MSRSTRQKTTVKTITNRDHVLTFGKYKGMTLAEVMEFNPDYLLYCQENIDWFDLDHKILGEVENIGRDDDELLKEVFANPSDDV